MKRSIYVAILLMVIGVYARPLMGQQQPPVHPAVKPPVTTSPPVTPVSGSLTPVAPGMQTTPAVVTTTVPSPASPTHAPEQIMWALAASYVFQWLKKSAWIKFVTPDTASRAQATMGFVIAALTAAGIHFAVSGSFLDGGVNISLTGVSLDAIKDVGFQWVSQQGWYDLLVRRTDDQTV